MSEELILEQERQNVYNATINQISVLNGDKPEHYLTEDWNNRKIDASRSFQSIIDSELYTSFDLTPINAFITANPIE